MEVIIFLVALIALFFAVNWSVKGDWRKPEKDVGDYQWHQSYDTYGLPDPDEVVPSIYVDEDGIEK